MNQFKESNDHHNAEYLKLARIYPNNHFGRYRASRGARHVTFFTAFFNLFRMLRRGRLRCGFSVLCGCVSESPESYHTGKWNSIGINIGCTTLLCYTSFKILLKVELIYYIHVFMPITISLTSVLLVFTFFMC